jgi:excisionase family DNA binding protein
MKKQAAVKPGMLPAVMTVRELAAYLRVHPSTIYRLLKQGQVPGFRIDRDWRFHIKTIEEWRSRIEAGLPSRDSSERRGKASADNPQHGSTQAGA